MTGSRARRLAYLLALLAPFAAAPAAAQWFDSDKPPVLTPDDYPPVADEPSQPADSTSQQQSHTSTDTASGAPRPLQSGDVVAPLPPPGQSVDVSTLGSAEGPPAGTIDALTGGLSGNIWTGSKRSVVLDLLKRAPLAYADPPFRDLVKKIVLTRAAAPLGPAKHAFVTMRIEKLLDAGLIDDAGALAAQASVENDPEFARVQARALLLAGRTGDICSDKTATRLSSGDPFWMELRTYCAAVSGDQATADLTMAVMKAQGKDDPAFDTLLEDALKHYGSDPGAIDHPTALDVFLFEQAGMPLPEALARKMGTAENLIVMRDQRNSPRVRFDAAERIIMTGAVSINALRLISDAQNLRLEHVANAADYARNQPFFMGQTLLRRDAVIGQRPAEKAHLMAEALSLGRKFDLFPLASALQSDIIGRIVPSQADRQRARLFVRALILAGRPLTASRWASGDPLMQTIAAMASGDPGQIAAMQKNFDNFAASLMKDPPVRDRDGPYKALAIGLADVLGMPLPKEARAQAAAIESQMWPGQRPGPGLMRTIEEVSLRPDRRGEALLMILDSMYQIGLDNMAPDVTIEYVRLLVSMNEARAARAIALDALAQYVPPPLPPPPTPAK